MEQYARNKKYNNVFFHGAYMPTDRYEFAKNTDMIHNVYDCGHTTGNAMGNKYYDGIIFGIPQICTAGSHMGDVVTERQVGMAVSLDGNNMADEIWAYYHDIDWEKFEAKCADALECVLNEQKMTKARLLDFIG